MVRDRESHRIRGWQGSHLSPQSEFTRDRKSELDFNALIRGPAEMVLRQKAGPMTASRRNVRNVGKTACQSGPFTYDRIAPASPIMLGPCDGRTMNGEIRHRPTDEIQTFTDERRWRAHNHRRSPRLQH